MTSVQIMTDLGHVNVRSLNLHRGRISNVGEAVHPHDAVNREGVMKLLQEKVDPTVAAAFDTLQTTLVGHVNSLSAQLLQVANANTKLAEQVHVLANQIKAMQQDLV